MGCGTHYEFSEEELAARKKAVFDSMKPRMQKRILKMGYDVWDPFEDPKDPIDIRTDVSKRTTQQLVREFLQSCPESDYSNLFAEGALDMALGIVNNNEKIRGMFEFAAWYQDLLMREGHVSPEKD